MGKRWCAALLCAVLACSMTGCGDFLDREWYEVKDHSPPTTRVRGATCCGRTPIRIW